MVVVTSLSSTYRCMRWSFNPRLRAQTAIMHNTQRMSLAGRCTANIHPTIHKDSRRCTLTDVCSHAFISCHLQISNQWTNQPLAHMAFNEVQSLFAVSHLATSGQNDINGKCRCHTQKAGYWNINMNLKQRDSTWCVLPLQHATGKWWDKQPEDTQFNPNPEDQTEAHLMFIWCLARAR